MRLGVPLLGVDKVGELGWVTQEENGSVVEHPVPVAVFRTKLDGKSARIACRVGRAALTSDCGDARSDLAFVSNFLENFRAREVGDVVGDLEVTVSAGTLGVHDTLCRMK